MKIYLLCCIVLCNVYCVCYIRHLNDVFVIEMNALLECYCVESIVCNILVGIKRRSS